MLTTNAGQCSVTVVSEWLAITAKHCGTGNPKLFLNVADVSKATPYQVKSINPSPTLDVEAIFLSKRTGLPVLSHRAVTQGPFSVWGYGHDYSSKFTNNLTRADFNHADACPASLSTGGSLCWQTSAVNSVCAGDSGGAVTQNGAVIGMVTAVAVTSKNPDGSLDCSKVLDGQALTVPQMQPWLDQMIKDADPTD